MTGWLVAVVICGITAHASDLKALPRAQQAARIQNDPAKSSAATVSPAPIQKNPVMIGSLKGVVIVGDTKEAKAGAVEAVSGLKVVGVPLLEGPAFLAVVKPYIGKPMRSSDLKRLERDIVLYCREKNLKVMDVVLPEQDFSSGVLRLVFLEGRVRQPPADKSGKSRGSAGAAAVQKDSLQLPETPAPGADKQENPLLVESLKGVVIVGNEKGIKAGGVQAVSGLKVEKIPLLEGPAFCGVVNPYLGKPMRLNDLKRLQRDIVLYCRHGNRPVVDVILPEQDLSNGVLQLLFLEGHARQVALENPGKKWFSERVVTGRTRLKPGEPVHSRRLLDDANWVNNNPFRQLDELLKQGKKLGEPDVPLNVQGRVLVASNSGNIFGSDKMWGSRQSAESATDFAHTDLGGVVAPLPWRHAAAISGPYVEAAPVQKQVAELAGASDTAQQGRLAADESWSSAVKRYAVSVLDAFVEPKPESAGRMTLAAAEPSQRTPKPPAPMQKEPAKLPDLPAPSPDSQENPTVVEPLKGIVIVADPKAIKPTGTQPVSGLVVEKIPLLEGPEFRAVMDAYVGKLMRLNDLKRLQRDIIIYCRSKNRPVVDVILPEQDLSNGVLQMLFIEGRVKQVLVDNAGKRWFSDKLVLKKVRVKPGDPVDSKLLLDDINWLNNNPFRQVDVLLRQGKKLGESDIQLNVKDRIPVRIYLGYEDSGTALTGKDRVIGGFNWGNAIGFDEVWNYQHSADSAADWMRANSGSVTIPLPWRHTLMLSGSYVEAKADFQGTSYSTLGQSARSWQASMRYSVPLAAVGKFTHQLTAGADFKRSNNSLEFGGTAISPSFTEILQLEGGYNFSMPDAMGQTSAGVDVYYSPGNLSYRNTAAAFRELRNGTTAYYTYGRLILERLTRLPYNCSWVLNASTQLTPQRLMPSEQMGLGGYQTVRGYDERVINGDQGWFVSNEFRLPAFSLPSPFNLGGWKVGKADEKPKSGKPGAADAAAAKAAKPEEKAKAPDQFQLFGFWDHGLISVNQALPSEAGNQWLSAVGLGWRYTINPYVSVRFDYGWQLHESGAARLSGLNFSEKSRGHLGVLIGF